MRIVVMDDVALSEEHMRILNSVGELVINTGTPLSREEILCRAKGAEILISGWTHYPEGIFAGASESADDFSMGHRH